MLDDMFRFGSLVRRVAAHNDQADYLVDVEEMMELSDQRDEVLARVSNAITQVHVYNEGVVSPDMYSPKQPYCSCSMCATCMSNSFEASY